MTTHSDLRGSLGVWWAPSLQGTFNKAAWESQHPTHPLLTPNHNMKGRLRGRGGSILKECHVCDKQILLSLPKAESYQGNQSSSGKCQHFLSLSEGGNWRLSALGVHEQMERPSAFCLGKSEMSTKGRCGWAGGEPVLKPMSHGKDVCTPSEGTRVGRMLLQPTGLLVWWGDPSMR